MPQDKVKEVYGLISDLGYFKDENEFKGYVSDPKRRKEAFDLISDTGYFKDENEFNSYFTDVVKPTPPPTGPQRETPQPRNKVAEMLNQPKAVDKLRQVVPTSEVTSGTKKPVMQKEQEVQQIKQEVAKTKQRDEYLEGEKNRDVWGKVNQKAVDQNIGVKELFKRESDNLAQFLTDDNKVEFDYYKQIDDATRKVNELNQLVSDTRNPLAQADLQKAKFDKFKAQQQLLKYEKGVTAQIDNEIANLEKIISTSANQKPELINSLKESIEKLKLQRENPNYLRNPDEQIKQIYSQVGGEIETFRIPGSTPREKIQNYSLILKQQLDDLENQIREIDPNAPLDKPTYTSGYNLARQDPQLNVLREKRMNLIPKLQVVAPIALINKMPTKDNDWFGSSFTKAVKAELLPDKFTKQNIQDMSDNEVSEFIYNNNVITNLAENDLTQSAISKSKELGAPVKAFSGNWWGNLAGTSASMIPAFALGSGAVQGVSTLAKIPSVLNMTRRLYRVSNIARTMQLGKYVVPTLKSAGKGIEYMAAEPFLNQEDLKDEASFLSGFLGQAVAGPMGRALSGKNVGNLVSFLFKENAPEAAKLITVLGNKVSSGLGEYGEEVGNTIGPLLDTYIKTGDFQNLKKDLYENFGTLDANMELFVGSTVMGMAMGSGTGLGVAYIQNSKNIYNQLPTEQQEKADAIANALKNDIEKAEVQAKKEEIQEGAEPLAEDILTEEDKQKKQEAIDKLNNPASTVAEKVEAGRVLNDIKIKEHNANITEKALEESEIEAKLDLLRENFIKNGKTEKEADSLALQSITEQERQVLRDSYQKGRESSLLPKTDKSLMDKQLEAEAKIERKDLFADGGTFSNILGGSGVNSVPTNHKKINGIEFVEFSNPNTGDVDVIMTGTSDADFVGFYRIYENGKPTNKWSSKFENQSRDKNNFKTMISGAQNMLPKGHEYTEKTSISTDGLRVWEQQLSRGYDLQFDKNGKLITSEVAINGDAIVNELGIDVKKGDFENISVTTKEQFEKVKKALLPYLEKFGLNESNIRNVNGTVEIDLPVLKSKSESTSAKEQSTQSEQSSTQTSEQSDVAKIEAKLDKLKETFLGNGKTDAESDRLALMSITEQERQVLRDSYNADRNTPQPQAKEEIVETPPSEVVSEEAVVETPSEEVAVEETKKEKNVRDLNILGADIGFDKPYRKNYEEGEQGDLDYANDNIKHNEKVDKTILNLNQEGVLTDSDGREYLVSITSQGVRVINKLSDGTEGSSIYYRNGKRVGPETPFTKGFSFKPKTESIPSTTQTQAKEEVVETPPSEVTPKEETKATPLVDKTKSVTQTITLGLKTQGDKEMESDLPYNDVRVLTDVKHKGKDGAVKESTRISGVDTNSSFYKTVKGKSGKNYIVVGVPSSDAVGRPAAATVAFEFNGEVTPEIENKLLSLDTKSYRDAQKMVFGPSLDKLQNDVADILNAKEVVSEEATTPKEEVGDKISIGISSEGWKPQVVKEDTFDARLDTVQGEVKDRNEKQKEFDKNKVVVFEVERKGETYIVAQVGEKDFGGRTGLGIATIKKEEGLPSDINDILIKKAATEWLKNKDFSEKYPDAKNKLESAIKGKSPKEEVGEVEVNVTKSDADIEKRMSELEETGLKLDTPELKEYNALEKEMEKRERDIVFNTPLENVGAAVDALIQKEKDKPNGFGAFIEKRDARETKEVAERYLSADKLTDTELKEDFKDALFGNPTTWYADGLKLRESMKEASNRGIVIDDLLKTVEKEFTKDGFDEATARKVIAGMLKPVFEGSQKVNENQISQQVESPAKQTTPSKEQAKEVVSEEVKQETSKKEVVKEQAKKAPAKEKPLTAKEKQAEQEVIIKDRILGRLSAYNKLSAFQQKTKGPSAEIVDIFATASKYGFTIKDANVQKPNRTKKYELFKDGKKVGKSQTKSDIPEATPEQVKVAEKLIDKDLVTAWNGDQTAPRLDANTYGISWQEIRQGEKDIKAGKTNSAPAKRLIQVLNQIESDGDVNMVVGSGGAAMKMGYRLSEARQAIKEFPEITDSDMEEINANLDTLAKEYEEWFATTLTEQEQNNILEENESRNQSEISENAEVRQGETNVSNEKDGTKEKGEEVTPKTSDARKARIGEQLKVAEENAKSLKAKLDKAQASLNKDREAMQQNMFQANQISLLNDVDAKAKKVSDIKRDYDAAKEEVKSLKEQFDSLLEGQTEMDMDGEKPKKSKPSKKEIQELSSIGVTNFNLPNLVEEVKQMSKTEFVAAKGSEFESKEQAESYWEDTRNGIFNKEVSDLKNTIDIEVRKSRNDLGMFKAGGGKMWTAMGKLMGLYVKKGVTSFGDFIQATGYKATSAMKGLWDSIRGRKSTIKLSTKNANIRNINARLFYTEALDGIPSTDDAQVILDDLKNTIDVYKTMSIHAAKNDVQDINNATDALTDLYVELSSDLETVKKRIAEELELGQKVFEAEKKLSVSEKLAEFFADDFRWQEKMQKEIEKTKGTLSDDMNPYIQKDIAIGRMADTVNRVYQKIFGKTYGEMATNKKGTEGMVQRMAKDGLNITDLDFFMMVQHAKEYNERVATKRQMEKDAEIKIYEDRLADLATQDQNDPTVKAQTTKATKALAAAQAIEIPDAGSGMTDAEADNFMKEFEKAGKKDKLEAYSKEFRETVITKSIDLREEAGDLSPEQAQALREGKDAETGVDFEFYVPLKVKKEARKERVGDGGTRGAALEPIQRIKGTNKYDYTKRISPVTQSLLDFQASVKLAEDNKVAQSLYNLVKENPNSAVWEIVDVAGLPGGDFALPSEIKDNSVKVKIGGKVKYIKFNHQGLRDAWLKNNGNPDPFLKLIYRAFNLYKSYKRAMVTQYSIEFAFTNAPRDLQDVIFNASGLDIKGFTKQVMKNYRKSMQGSFKAIMGNLDPNSQMGKVIDEYLSGGGKISWMNYNEIESEQKRVQSLVAKYGDKGAAYYSKQAMKNTVATLGAINESVEMGTRIAVFKACRDLGISIDQAATISKNLSVNFNKKGTATPSLQALWLFSNAGFQSLYAGMKALRTPKGKKVAAITFGLGMAMPFIQETLIQLLSADDEEEAFYRNANSPEENANYYILPMGDRRLYRFPKSYGMMRVMFNSGYELGALYLDGNVEEHAASMASTIWSTMDPITGNSNNKLSAVMPTALRPWIEVNYLNRNYNDIPILPEEYGAKQNDYLRYYERTNDLYKDIAKSMYFKSGETIDVSPETLEYIVTDATGGIISTGFKTYEMVDALFKGTEVDKNKIPFYSKFVVDMKQQEYRYSKDFYEIYDDRGKSVIDKIRFDNAYKYAKEGNAMRKSKGQPDLVKDLEKKKREIEKAQKEVILQKEQREDYKKPKERK
jgi:hypothetical protein